MNLFRLQTNMYIFFGNGLEEHGVTLAWNDNLARSDTLARCVTVARSDTLAQNLQDSFSILK